MAPTLDERVAAATATASSLDAVPRRQLLARQAARLAALQSEAQDPAAAWLALKLLMSRLQELQRLQQRQLQTR
jgi:hypothetical protein